MTTLPVAVPNPKLPKPKPPRAVLLARGDYEFLPAALEILETPPSPVRAALLLTVCAFATAALVWSWVGHVDVIATAPGKIQPVGRTKTVQPLETGKVARVAAGNGQAVREGDVLIVLDGAEARADEAAVEADLEAGRAEIVRRNAALRMAAGHASGPPPTLSFAPGTAPSVAAREQRVLEGDAAQLAGTLGSLDGQRREKEAERARLAATIAAQEVLVTTLQERVTMRSDLMAMAAESRAKVIDALELMQTQAATLAAEKGQLGEAEASLARIGRDTDKAVAAFAAENAQKLADAEHLVDDNEAKLAKAQAKIAHLTLESPIDGVVQGSVVTAPGQVLTAGEQVMEVVPTGAALEIEGYLPNADAGFVHQGQTAVVKVEAFPFTDYGTVDATVTAVARDAIPEPEAETREANPAGGPRPTGFGAAQHVQNLVYPVTLTLARSAVKAGDATVPLGPGMAVTVEIKTASRRIIDFLVSPILKTTQTAFHER